MMYKNITKILVFAWMLLIVHACDDKLEIDDPNRLTADQFYQTQDQAVAAVDAIYNSLITDGMYMRTTPTIGDGRGDELESIKGFPMWEQTANFTIPPTIDFIEFVWHNHYIMISRTNQVLENVPDIEGIEPDLKDRLLGQAYFFRAFAYFTLTNIYDNVPILLSTPEEGEFYPSNEGVTQQDVYDQVEADLDMAIGMLPLNYNDVSGPDNGQVFRVTKGAANSLMGKLLLYQERHDEALPYFEAVVQSNEYELAEDYADLFSQDPAVEASNPGRIFWVEFTQSENPADNWGGDPNASWKQFSALAPTYSIADFGDYSVTPFLYNEMREELTIDGDLDERYHATILSYEPDEGYTTAYGEPWPYGEDEFFIKKYTLAATGGNPFTCGINYHLIRFADVLLMYAESLANTGSIPQAATQVQRVRDRANLPDREAEFAGYTLDEFMEQLAHERVMELAIENIRWYDILRWGWLDDPDKLAELRANDPEIENFVPTRKYMPFPQRELDLNPNLEGNSVNKNE